MKKLSISCITVLATLVCASMPAVAAGPGEPGDLYAGQLDETETNQLLYMREEEKLARDVYIKLHALWDRKAFANIAESEQRHMDAMLKMLTLYGIDDPVGDAAEGVFTDPILKDLYDDLVARGSASVLEAFYTGAWIEERDILDLQTAMDYTDEAPLDNAYSNLQSGSRNHLRTFVAHIEALGEDYVAQIMSQQAVDDIVGDFELVSNGEFSINPGLNDAWYYPATDGQGFVISVYPGAKTVFFVWFTYDTELPPDDATANLGDPGQRWLVAQGSYSGPEAELEVGSMSGGLFDSEQPFPVRTPGGSILLQFENCNSGSVFYDIPSIGRTGMVPIQRVNSENVALCTQQGGN